jgi:hypothetical protein
MQALALLLVQVLPDQNQQVIEAVPQARVVY